MALYDTPQAPKTNLKNRQTPAVKARSRAQQIAFAPIIFYAADVMRKTGLLACLNEANSTGLTSTELSQRVGLSDYAVSVLMDLAVDVEIVKRQGDSLLLDDLGYFLLNDTMTQVNMDFVRDICYKALPFLERSLMEGRPAGLHTLGDWSNVYQGLSQLEEPARSSWFRFDHYYSDAVFDNLLSTVFEQPVQRLLDIGANTGRWALKCLAYDAQVHMVMVDLPGQLNIAAQSITASGFCERVTLCPMDVLADGSQFPGDCDVIWMSQFLDCFSPENITNILHRLCQQMDANTRLYILEPFSDKQQFTAASLSLNATSLYFTCVANGASRMYCYDEFRPLVEAAGLVIDSEKHLNFGHSLLVCRIKNE
ncbi:MAG: class I SAM-dependent methyltransferase [Cellvibrionaceae bacterium]